MIAIKAVAGEISQTVWRKSKFFKNCTTSARSLWLFFVVVDESPPVMRRREKCSCCSANMLEANGFQVGLTALLLT